MKETSRVRKFTLKDGTTVDYRKNGCMRSKVVTSPCGASIEEHWSTEVVILPSTETNFYSDLSGRTDATH